MELRNPCLRFFGKIGKAAELNINAFAPSRSFALVEVSLSRSQIKIIGNLQLLGKKTI